MGETPLYSTVKFEKDFRHKPEVTQNEDVSYSEVKSTGPTSSSTVCQSAPAVSQDEDAEVRSTNPTCSGTVCPSAAAEKSVGSSHPYRLAAVCLGLLCALLLAATLVLCVVYTSLSQNYSLQEAELVQLKACNITMTEERNLLQGNYIILHQDNDLLKKENNDLKQEKDQLQRNNSIFQQALSQKLPFIEQYCPFSSEESICKACPQDWKQFDSKCYFFSTVKKSWKGSHTFCSEQGANLVIIKSKEEQEFISKRILRDSWIGLSDAKTEKRWIWVDETPLRTGFWKNGEPDQWSYDLWTIRHADCAVTGTGVKTWKDENCNMLSRFICETDALLL